MQPSQAERVLEAYSAEATAAAAIQTDDSKPPGLNTSAISNRLTTIYGGFWDIFLMGEGFSYAIYCIDYVELAGEYWTVLICKESIDEWGNDCGEHGLSLYANGSLAAMDDATVLLTDDFYQNYWKGDELKEAHMKSAIKLLSAIDYRQVNGTLANGIRTQAEKQWPSNYWNVLVERRPGDSYFFCDEQMHLSDRQRSVTFVLFDRQCQSPDNQERVSRHARPRHARPMGLRHPT